MRPGTVYARNKEGGSSRCYMSPGEETSMWVRGLIIRLLLYCDGCGWFVVEEGPAQVSSVSDLRSDEDGQEPGGGPSHISRGIPTALTDGHRERQAEPSTGNTVIAPPIGRHHPSRQHGLPKARKRRWSAGPFLGEARGTVPPTTDQAVRGYVAKLH